MAVLFGWVNTQVLSGDAVEAVAGFRSAAGKVRVGFSATEG